MTIKFHQTILSWRGRARRCEYWLSQLGIFACIIPASISFLGSSYLWVDKALDIIAGIGVIAVLWCVSMVYVKRAHDLGWSGWWLLLPLALTIAFGILYEILSRPEAIGILCFLGVSGVQLYQFAYLGFIRGDKEPNKYGEPPAPIKIHPVKPDKTA